MRILVSNDDGIMADGLITLVKRLSEEHEVYVAAPDRQRSAYSHSVTYFLRDLHARLIEVPGAYKAWSVDGTPADCVYAAVCGLMEEAPDLVVSGINRGWNVSYDCIYSGTVGAASEGTILGIPSIAVSLASDRPYEFETSAEITAQLLKRFMEDPDRYEYVLNVNIPSLPKEAIKGIRPAKFDGRKMYGRKLDVNEENGVLSLHCPLIDVPVDDTTRTADGDITLVEDGFVTVSPIRLDWIDERYFDNAGLIAGQ